MTEPKIGQRWNVKDGATTHYVVRGFVDNHVISKYTGMHNGYHVVSREWFDQFAILEQIKKNESFVVGKTYRAIKDVFGPELCYVAAIKNHLAFTITPPPASGNAAGSSYAVFTLGTYSAESYEEVSE